LTVDILPIQVDSSPDASSKINLGLGLMSAYPQLRFSTNEIKRAGKRLAGNIVWNDNDRSEILQTFEIAHNWRNAHVYPMRSVRASVIGRLRSLGIPGVTAARAKRMASIRRKLQKTTTHLSQMQDLGGCRAIVEDIEGARRLAADCLSRMPHDVLKEQNYIETAKSDGYRSHHIIYSYKGQSGKTEFDGRRIELQIRTRLQHAWSTAVEAVGLYRNENMKAGEGSIDWLRLFKCVSDEIAFAEGCETGRLAPSRPARIAEIRELNSTLGAVDLLENLKNATQYVETHLHPGHASLYLLKYDHSDHTVSVQSYFDPLSGAASFDEAERAIEEGLIDTNVVLVEADKITSLADAYPNYFGDVTLFISTLRKMCRDVEAPEFALKKQHVVKPKPKEMPDLSWFFNRHRRWTDKQ